MGMLLESARWLDSRWRIGLAILGGVLALVGPYFGSLSDDRLRQNAGLLVGIVGLLMSAILPILDKNAQNREIGRLKDELGKAAERARTEFLFLTEFNLIPLVHKLGKVVLARKNSRSLDTQAAELRQQALATAREVIGGEHPHVRANYFKLEYPSPGTSVLVSAGSTARPPRQSFDPNTAEGDAVLNMLAQSGTLFCPNVSTDPPSGWDTTKTREYETFISVTAIAAPGTEPDGMMTIDGRHEGDLKEADVSMLKLIASIVAVSESQRNIT